MPSQSFREEFVRSNYGKIPVKEIAENLGVSENAVQRIRSKLGMDTVNSPWNRYGSKSSMVRAEREFFVRDNYGKMPIKEMAEKLGVSDSAVYRIGSRIGMVPIRRLVNGHERSKPSPRVPPEDTDGDDWGSLDLSDFDELSVCQVVNDGLRMPLRGADLYEAVRRSNGKVDPEVMAWRLDISKRHLYRVREILARKDA